MLDLRTWNQNLNCSSNPMEIKTDTVSSLGSNKLTFANTLPKMSFLPQCFFDKVIGHDLILSTHFRQEAQNFWALPEYDKMTFFSEKSKKVINFHLKADLSKLFFFSSGI